METAHEIQLLNTAASFLMYTTKLINSRRLICSKDMLHELACIIAKHVFFLITMLLGIIVQPKLYSRIIFQDAVELLEQLLLGKYSLVAIFDGHIGTLEQFFLEGAREHWRCQNRFSANFNKLICQSLNTILQQTARISHCMICKKCALPPFSFPLLHNVSSDPLIILHNVLADIIICGLNTAQRSITQLLFH
ncbi:hypothetical protein D1872_198640 [compost metagenome]